MSAALATLNAFQQSLQGGHAAPKLIYTNAMTQTRTGARQESIKAEAVEETMAAAMSL